MPLLTRRRFFGQSSSALGGAAVLASCSLGADPEHYDAVAERTWHLDVPGGVEPGALVRELVRCATLAPSSHNTQCWRFSAGQGLITILPDFARRCPVVDPDDHHVFVTLGCATENLVQAARAHGLNAVPRFVPGQEVIEVVLEAGTPDVSALFRAIPMRQCTRGEYDGRPLLREELNLLERAGTGRGVRVLLLTARAAIEEVLEFVVLGNSAQLEDPAFRRELKAWIRFSSTDAVRTRDGLFSGSSGSPDVPSWIGEPAFDWFFTAGRENDKIARQLRSSAGVAVFVGESAGRANWVEVGRAYERFALQATALGIRNAFLNQPIEVSEVRGPFAGALGVSDRRPDLVVRFGRGPGMPRSLRRPVETVMV